MRQRAKKQSNPFSLGGGGVFFESQVQAAFTVLMMAGGFAPCLPVHPIFKIQLQGSYAGYDTDDLIVFTKDSVSNDECKLFAQIKHTISITEKSPVFGEVIQAAWFDFNNSQLFNPKKDIIALITGPLSTTDIENVRTILEWARHSINANEFLTKVEMVNFSSDQKRAKLKAFRVQLEKANKSSITNDEFWQFMRCFHLLGYDLDIKAGVTLSLLHSLIGQYSPENAHNLWLQVVEEVQSANQNSGTIDIDHLPQEIRDAFKGKPAQVIPEDLIKKDLIIEKITANDMNLFPLSQATELALATLIGTWNEGIKKDKEVVEILTTINYSEWMGSLREAFFQSESLLSIKNKIWKVTKRLEAWDAFGSRLFDDHLDKFKEIVVIVLREGDPKFKLTPDQRFAANIHGIALSHSPNLRKGLSESLALLGSHPGVLTSCSQGKAETIARLAVREILKDADWILWASLDPLLPLLAEAAPREFLNNVKSALASDPCPFNILFSQEDSGFIGTTYITGLLWALETLAWDAEYFTQVVVILGELAVLDPGGNWSNRPKNSLTTILLPWFPQTYAPIIKRKSAVEILIQEEPDVAWNLLVSLLPQSHQISPGSHRPVWRNPIPENQQQKVSRREYWEQIAIYADLSIEMAMKDLEKITELIDHYDQLPLPAQEQLLVYLSSSEIQSRSEVERLPLWNKLVDLVTNHRKYANVKWAMKPEQIDAIDVVANQLAPVTPFILNQRLFSNRGYAMFDERGDFEGQQKQLLMRQQDAVKEIFSEGGVPAVLKFAHYVDSARDVGIALGLNQSHDADRAILPGLLSTEEQLLKEFTGGFVRSRFQSQGGWEWVDGIDISEWEPAQIGQFFAHLPFTSDAWDRSSRALGSNESEYWIRTDAYPYDVDKNLDIAVDKLIRYRRPLKAVRCISANQDDKHPFESNLVIRALLAVTQTSEKTHQMDAYEITELIKSLQSDSSTDADGLFNVEWAYLPLLDHYHDASPITMEWRLAEKPEFFCEVIRAAFRSSKEEPKTEASTEKDQVIATNAYRLLSEWSTPPGSQRDGSFDGDRLAEWIDAVRKECIETGHLEIALSKIGQVLTHAPPDPDGLWIHRSAASVLNSKDADEMREGFKTQLFNSQGAQYNNGGQNERELAAKYKVQADDVENNGFYRLANTLRVLAETYEHYAEWELSNDPFED